jgi:hypothetical protein
LFLGIDRASSAMSGVAEAQVVHPGTYTELVTFAFMGFESEAASIM